MTARLPLGPMRTLAALALLAAGLVAGRARAQDLRTAAEEAAAELGAALKASADARAVKQVAIAPLEEAPTLKGYARVAEEALATRLATAAGVSTMDRAKLAAVLGEQKLGAMLGSGKTGAEAELATLAGAQAVLSGKLVDAGDRVTLQLRLATSPGGRVIATAKRDAELPRKATAPRAAAVESGSIDVAMRKLADRLADGFGKLPGNAKYRRLAVLTFTEVGEESKRRQMGTIVTAEVATNLRRDHGLLLVERAKLGEVLGELKLQQALVDAAQAGQIGRMSDAQAVVLGSVSDAGDRYLVNARIVATDSGETLAAESQPVPSAAMVSLASDAVVLRSRSGAVFRSVLVPGFGQFYNRQPVKAWTFIGAEAALLGSALAFHLAGNAAYADYREAGRASLGGNPSAEASQLYDVAASRYATRDWLLVGAAAVWAVNVADAYFSGVDGSALLSGGTASVPSPGPAVAAAPVRGGAMALVTVPF